MNEETIVEEQAAINPDKLASLLAELKAKQNFPMAVGAGVVAALIGAVLWAVVTAVTGWQIGFMAIGVGFLVGWAVSKFGKGLDSIYGVAGGGLALLGCVTGNFLTIVAFISKEYEIGLTEVLSSIEFSEIPSLMVETFQPMDALFYGIAVFQAYKMSFHQISPEQVAGLQA